MKVTLKILLAVAVVLLAYMCYRSIMGPIEFKDEKDRRENLIKARLIDIRKAQIEYKNIHKVHAANFDELSKFLKDEKLPFLIKEGVLTDEQLEKGMTEKEAVKKGLIRRDTIWVTAVDTGCERTVYDGYGYSYFRFRLYCKSIPVRCPV